VTFRSLEHGDNAQPVLAPQDPEQDKHLQITGGWMEPEGTTTQTKWIFCGYVTVDRVLPASGREAFLCLTDSGTITKVKLYSHHDGGAVV